MRVFCLPSRASRTPKRRPTITPRFKGSAYRSGNELIIGYIKPGIKIDEETLAKTLEAIRKEYNAPQVQLAFVAEDKKIGDGVLGLAGVTGKEKPVYLLPKDEEQAKLLAKVIGYDMSPKALWKAYDENEVVADQDFKGRPIIFEATLSEVAKDVFGKPYVKIPVDQHGFFGIQVTLKEDDPALRKIKKGMKVTVRGRAGKVHRQDPYGARDRHYCQVAFFSDSQEPPPGGFF